jgi:hypothetical protein
VAKETLGIFLAIDGNNKDVIIKLQDKTKEFVEQLQMGIINKCDA